MKKIKLLFLLNVLLIISCNTEQKKTTGKIDSKKIELTQKQKLKNQINDFFNEHKAISNESYVELYNLLTKDYALNRDQSKYEMIIHIAKKTLKEKDSATKNLMYNNLKKEY